MMPATLAATLGAAEAPSAPPFPASEATRPRLKVEGLEKSFTLHLRDGARLPVVRNVSFEVHGGECVALGGPSGAGKSSILKMIFGNYRADAGTIEVADGPHGMIDVVRADPRRILKLRRERIGYVSQFLRVIPRVRTLDVVSEPLRQDGVAPEKAEARARDMLARLNLPQRLWDLPPATFSGGEQQRVNIARGFISPRDLLLLDEPTASLDAANQAVVVDLIGETKARGTALIGIFHDTAIQAAVSDRVIDVSRFRV